LTLECEKRRMYKRKLSAVGDRKFYRGLAKISNAKLKARLLGFDTASQETRCGFDFNDGFPLVLHRATRRGNDYAT